MPPRIARPLIRILAIGLLLLLAAAATVRLVGKAKLGAARQRFEADTGSLSLSDYVLPALGDDVNAAVWLRRGAEALVLSDAESTALSELLEADLAALSGAEIESTAALIERNAAALELLARAQGLEGSTFDFDYERGFDAALPPMIEMVRAAKLLGADVRLGLLAGESGRVARDLAVLDGLADALARESFLISVLLHLGVERQALAAVRDVVGWRDSGSELLSPMPAKLSTHDCAQSVRRAIAGEAAAVLAAEDRPEAYAHPPTPGERLELWLMEPFWLAAMLDTYRELAGMLDQPWVTTLAARREPAGEVLWGPHQLLLPNLLDAVDRVGATGLGRRLAVEAIAIRLEGLRSGSYPIRLAEPLDESYGGGAVNYELRPDGGASLSAPRAVSLWEAEHSAGSHRSRPVFSWSLPPIPG